MAQPTGAHQTDAQSPVRVLIVASAQAAGYLQALLTRGFGEHVLQATQPTAQAARTFLAEQGADLLIADLRLPDGSGADLCRAVRTIPALAALPIMLLADAPTAAERIDAMTSGADDVIARPIEDRLFLARIELLWRTKGHGQALRR